MKILISDFVHVILLSRGTLYTGDADKFQADIHEQGSTFWALNQLNQPLLTFIQELLCKKVIFTTGTTHQAPEVVADVAHYFEAVYTTTQIGYSKSDPKSFKKLCLELECPPHDCFFIDDQFENVRAAQVAGLTATQYTTVTAAQSAIMQWYQSDTINQL
ncbi:MAG: HAD family hydrolase [Pseudomonadales bacterium]|nr:HAD family hydrolase [Candidatus Woesebacteria bacterium]MCB9801303.1 HAD family hydrolase [Pseudomonadales bacterium]